MTEAEWLECTDPEPMLDFLPPKHSPRKCLLFSCACYYHVWERLRDDEPLKSLTLMMERYADTEVSYDELNSVYRRVSGEIFNAPKEYNWDTAIGAAWATAEISSDPVAAGAIQAALVRDIFGNPFHPVPIDSSWLTPAVTGLAQVIYNGRAFDRMPELADVLEHAGCTSHEILDHCRGGAKHVRGCWVVDLVLGKS